VFGYVLSAVAFALLLSACLTVWRKRLAGSGLVAALTGQLAWSIALALQGAGVPVSATFSIGIEYLRDLLWALVLVQCLQGSVHGRWLRLGQRALAIVIALVALAAAGSLLPQEAARFSRYLDPYTLWGGFGLCIGGLVLVEQVARNTRSAHRWMLKHVWLAIGGFYAWDLCLFATAMMHGGSAADFWMARGFVNTLLAVPLAIGLWRIPEWESAAFLSPRVVFFNATFLGAAGYVFVMAFGSYYVRRLGGSWGAAGQILFLAAAALVLSVAVLSEKFRALLRVTIAKHIAPYRYDYRTEWRKLTRALSEPTDDPVYERIAKVVAGMLSATAAGLWLRDSEGAYTPAGGDLAPAQGPREAGCREFFDFLLDREWIFDLAEARDPRGRRFGVQPPAWMLADPHMWLVVPLICEGSLVGFVVVGESLAQVDLSWEEIDLLRAAGRQVASYLAFEQAAKRLAEAHQFEAMNRLSAVIMHDLRHLIAQQALVVENATRHRGNPEFFDDAVLTIEHSVKRMTRLMEELRSGTLAVEAHRVELNEACAEAVRRCAGVVPAPSLERGDRGVEVVLNRDRLLQVLEHVIRNAQQATPPDGLVTLSVHRAGPNAIVEVADTGTGMDAEFIRNRLFRPFDSTKGEQGLGIGAYQAREFIRKCGGSVEVESAPGRGTRFIIRLPLAPALAPTPGATEHELEAR
jgi:putative PEP-CTERM system histidine kinase